MSKINNVNQAKMTVSRTHSSGQPYHGNSEDSTQYSDLTISNTDTVSVTESSAGEHPTRGQEHARPRLRVRNRLSSIISSDTMQSLSNTSLSSSITKFRNDFDEIKCKMRIFGESLSLCRCLASDFEDKLSLMEKRLQNLEKREKIIRKECNYSAIIQKNKKLNNKTVSYVRKLQMCGTEEEMREVAGRICKNYLHGAWKTVETSSLDFRRISGGLSNFLYYVGLPEEKKRSDGTLSRLSYTMDEPRKVLIRIYGQVHGERAMDAIVTESVIFTLLSERKLGPKLHGVFSGGRIEEYINARPLVTRELSEPALSMKIAEKMAAIHSMEVPLGKEPNWLCKTMMKWLKTGREESLLPSTVGKNEEEDRIIKRLKAIDFEKEYEWVKKFIATIESPVVFCHNDMQEGNILLFEDSTLSNEDDVSLYGQNYDSVQNANKMENDADQTIYEDFATNDSICSHLSDSGEPKLSIIDFEYCAYNYRGFDIANHFQEWVYDYTNPAYPFYYEYVENRATIEQKEIFIREYLKNYYANTGDRVREVTVDEVNAMLNEIDAFAIVSHFFWTLWSIVNAAKSQIPFGYWEYGQARLDTYYAFKAEYIKKQGLPQKRKICEVDI